MSNPRLPITGNYNTYVGARYVPIFDGDWNINKEYEPLVIVQYQGASYTSKTYVPTGTQITNTVYWALTGNYNAQVQAYRDEVFTFNDRINANAGDISSLKTRMSTAEGNIESLQSHMGTAESNISSLQEHMGDAEEVLSQLKYRKFIFVGDSYAHNNTGWLPPLINFLGLSENDYTDATRSGSAFQTLPSRATFLSLLQGANSPTGDDNVTDIVVLGGRNEIEDGGNAADIPAAITAFCNYAHTRFKNAKVRIGFIAWAPQEDPSVRLALLKIAWVYRACSSYGATYLNGVEYANLDGRNFANDNIHPNATGGIWTANAVKNALIQGSATVDLGVVESYWHSSGISGHSGTVYQRCVNGMCEIAFKNATLEYSGGPTLPGGTYQAGYIYNMPFLRQKYGNDFVIPCELFVVFTDETSQVIDINIGLRFNQVYFFNAPRLENVAKLVLNGYGQYQEL